MNSIVFKPAEASLAPVAFFFLIFIGIIIVINILSKKNKSGVSPISKQALYKRGKNNTGGNKIGGCFLMIFFLAVITGGTFFVLKTFSDQIASFTRKPAFVKTECNILISEVREMSGRSAASYFPYIKYEYTFNANTYESETYALYKDKPYAFRECKKIVSKFPAGSGRYCYVNPLSPEISVLSRISKTAVVVLSFFIAVGFLCILGFFKGLRLFFKPRDLTEIASSALRLWLPKTAFVGIPPAEVFDLQYLKVYGQDERWLSPEIGAKGKFFGAIFICLFWNGIVSIFLVNVINEWIKGNHPWFLSLFLLPFLAVGIGLIIAVFYFFLASFNPKVILKMVPGLIISGKKVSVHWQITGKATSVKELSIILEGIESATFRRGTDTVTEKSAFYRQEIFKSSGNQPFYDGRVEFTIPSNMMHTFESSNNKIIWQLNIKGEIPKWPDINDEYKLTVLPADMIER